MSDSLHITVMLGGPSAEREVSLKTGAAVAGALRSLGHTVHELDPQDDTWTLVLGTDVNMSAVCRTIDAIPINQGYAYIQWVTCAVFDGTACCISVVYCCNEACQQ